MTTHHRLDFVRLGQYMRRRREERGLSQDVIGALGGPSDTKVGELETGRYDAHEMRAGTLGKIDVAFGWRPGGAEAILRGGEPIPDPSWPHELVRYLRDQIVHGTATGRPVLSQADRRRIFALALRLEQECESAEEVQHLPKAEVEDVLERHRQAFLDQIDEHFARLRQELYTEYKPGMHDAPTDPERPGSEGASRDEGVG